MVGCGAGKGLMVGLRGGIFFLIVIDVIDEMQHTFVS